MKYEEELEDLETEINEAFPILMFQKCDSGKSGNSGRNIHGP